MLLAIDSGNTNIVFAIYEGENLKGEWRASSDAKRTADEYGVWLTHLMVLDDLKVEEISASIMATVFPETLFSLKNLCRKYFKTEPLIVGDAGVEIGVDILIDLIGQIRGNRSDIMALRPAPIQVAYIGFPGSNGASFID